MLHDTGDLPRLIAHAADWARHDRMLDITGGDAAALTEITDVQALLLRQEEPDLPALARLNVHRCIITARNAHVPPELPVAWARIGRLERAEALARSISSPDGQVLALVRLAATVGSLGDLDRAEALARTITSPGDMEWALADLAVGAAGAGDLDRAGALARSIITSDDQARTLIRLVQMAARVGDLDRAGALADQAEAATQTLTPLHHVRAMANTPLSRRPWHPVMTNSDTCVMWSCSGT